MDGNRQPEPSFLVIGISIEKSIELATKYHQLGFVFGHIEGPASLWILDYETKEYSQVSIPSNAYHLRPYFGSKAAKASSRFFIKNFEPHEVIHTPIFPLK